MCVEECEFVWTASDLKPHENQRVSEAHFHLSGFVGRLAAEVKGNPQMAYWHL